MGGGKGGGGNKGQQQAYDNAYNAAASGQPYDVALSNQSGYQEATDLAYQDYGASSYGPMGGGGSEFEGLFKQMEAQQNLQAQQAAENARLQEEYRRQQEIAQGTAVLDQLFSGRLDAATRASSDVEKQISDEFSHAQTRGLDYSVDDIQKQERVNNLFAEYWGEGQEAEFSEYSSKFATDRHKWTLPTVRGVGPSSSGALPDAVKVGGKVQRGAGTVITEDDEEAPTDTTLLGA